MSAPRVLIVDDNAINIALAEAVVSDEGFEIETACNGQDARSRVHRLSVQAD